MHSRPLTRTLEVTSMTSSISAETYPSLYAAFEEISRGGAGVSATFDFASEPSVFDTFSVPPEYACLVEAAEAGLARLYSEDIEAWLGFIFADTPKAEETRKLRGDLDEAERLLSGHFNGWHTKDDVMPGYGNAGEFRTCADDVQ